MEIPREGMVGVHFLCKVTALLEASTQVFVALGHIVRVGRKTLMMFKSILIWKGLMLWIILMGQDVHERATT